MNRRCVICGAEPEDNNDSKQNFYFPKSKTEALIWQRCMKADNVSLDAIYKYCCLCIEHIPQFVRQTQQRAASLNSTNIEKEAEDIRCCLKNYASGSSTRMLKSPKSVNVLVLTGASLPLFCGKSSAVEAKDLNKELCAADADICVLESNFSGTGTAFPDIDNPEFRMMRASAKNHDELVAKSGKNPKNNEDDYASDSMQVLLLARGEHTTDVCPCNCEQCTSLLLAKAPSTNIDPPNWRTSMASTSKGNRPTNECSCSCNPSSVMMLDKKPNTSAEPIVLRRSTASAPRQSEQLIMPGSDLPDTQPAMLSPSIRSQSMNESPFSINDKQSRNTATSRQYHSTNNYLCRCKPLSHTESSSNADLPNTQAAMLSPSLRQSMNESPFSAEQSCRPINIYLCRCRQCTLSNEESRSNADSSDSRTSVFSSSRKYHSTNRCQPGANTCALPATSCTRTSQSSNESPCVCEQPISQLIECQSQRITKLEQMVCAQNILYGSLQNKVEEMHYQLNTRVQDQHTTNNDHPMAAEPTPSQSSSLSKEPSAKQIMCMRLPKKMNTSQEEHKRNLSQKEQKRNTSQKKKKGNSSEKEEQTNSSQEEQKRNSSQKEQLTNSTQEEQKTDSSQKKQDERPPKLKKKFSLYGQPKQIFKSLKKQFMLKKQSSKNANN